MAENIEHDDILDAFAYMMKIVGLDTAWHDSPDLENDPCTDCECCCDSKSRYVLKRVEELGGIKGINHAVERYEALKLHNRRVESKMSEYREKVADANAKVEELKMDNSDLFDQVVEMRKVLRDIVRAAMPDYKGGGMDYDELVEYIAGLRKNSDVLCRCVRLTSNFADAFRNEVTAHLDGDGR